MSAVLIRTEMGLQVHELPADRAREVAGERDLGTPIEAHCGRFVCAWCRADIGPAYSLQPGSVSHGMCSQCADDFCSELESPTSQSKPAEDRGAQPAAAQGAHLGGSISVRPHPQGGWTLAYPLGGSAYEYVGWYRTESQALSAAWQANGGVR